MTSDVMLAKSKAGHDKNHVYVVLEEVDDSYLLVNGGTKKISSPKRKKKIHVQLIKQLPERVLKQLDGVENIDDALAEKILKSYQED